MAQIKESISSPTLTSGEKKSATKEYVITGTTSAEEALYLLGGTSPISFSVSGVTVYRTSGEVAPEAGDIWTGTASYSEKERNPATEKEQQSENGWGGSISFDTAGTTSNVSTSLRTVEAGYNQSLVGAAPDFGGLINVSGSDVKGVDIIMPGLKFTETHEVPFEVITTEYASELSFLTGSVNDNTFRGFAAGEVLFTGCSGQTKSAEIYTMSYNFVCQPSMENVPIGPFPGISKKGHEYLWVYFSESEDEDAKELVKQPVAYYVEQVYPEGDFSRLGIG